MFGHVCQLRRGRESNAILSFLVTNIKEVISAYLLASIETRTAVEA